MRHALILGAAAATLCAGAAQAASVELRDVVARVTVIPEARDDIRVEVLKANPRLPLTVKASRGRTVVDGKLHWDVGACDRRGGKPVVRVRGVGEVAWDDMPQIVIRSPRDLAISAGGAVFGAIGRTDSLDMVSAGCGDWTIGNVAGGLNYVQAGAGAARIGSAESARLRGAGSGDMVVGAIRNGITIDIAGSGDVRAAAANGPIDIKVAGSGDVAIARGSVTAMTVSVAGSGGVDFGGQAQSLKANIAGSGDVRARAVTGPVRKRVAGSGRVVVGEPRVKRPA